MNNTVVIETGNTCQIIAEEGKDAFQFRNDVEEYVTELLDHLQIRQQFVVHIKKADKSAASPLWIYINGQSADVEVQSMDNHLLPDVSELAMEAICENRELFLNPALCDAMRSQWLAAAAKAGIQDPSQIDFDGVLGMLIKAGHGMDHLNNWLAGLKIPDDERLLSTEVVAEDLISHTGPLSLKLFIGKNLISHIEQIEAAATQLQLDEFYNIGILRPKLVVLQQEHFPGDSWQLQINDLLFPRHCKRPSPELPLSPVDAIIFDLKKIIRRHATAFITSALVKNGLQVIGRRFPLLIANLTQRFSVAQITRSIRNLAEDGVLIRDLELIFQAMLAVNGGSSIDHKKYVVFSPNTVSLCPTTREKSQDELGVDEFSEPLRFALRRSTCWRYVEGGHLLLAILLAPAIEDRLAQVSENPLNQVEHDVIIDKTAKITAQNVSGKQAILLTTVGIRKALRQVIQKSFPDLPVLSYEELLPQINIQPLGTIG
ncbi:MAG: FHIPEP family type III secretion protein [Acidobacteriia bacterium]|nr:FHIPEP family type III secretion protein [Terriglobia bacterium]